MPNWLKWLLVWPLVIVFVCDRPLAEGLDEAGIVEETMRFLKAGDSVLELDDKYRNVTLLVGKTGTGKSTLTLFLTGDLADLEAVKKDGYFIKYKYEGIIGTSTTVSQTIYPALHIDDINLAYYDCPGYDDTRNTSIEIAATYFVKRVVDHATALKIVLVANYDSVHVAGSRADFASLVDHLRRFIKNFDRYKDSIALVATKVENQPTIIDGAMALVPDDEMIRDIAGFFREYQGELLKNPNSEFNKIALQLLDVLLTSRDNGTTYDKIALFRKPMQAGKLSTIKTFVDEREALRRMIINNTVYSPRYEDDFGYTISSDSKLRIIKLAEKINDNIAANVRSIANEIQQYYSDNSTTAINFRLLTARFEEADRLLSVINEGVASLTLPVFMARLLNATRQLDIPISHEYLNDIENQQKYIDFLQSMREDAPLQLNAAVWVSAIEDCIKLVRGNALWYTFLTSLYKDYSAYDFRQDLTKYNVRNIDDWGQSGKEQGILIDAKNFAAFAKRQTNGASVASYQPTVQQLAVLNRILDVMLKATPVYKCRDNALIVKGEFVRLSEIDLGQCGDKLKALNVYALDTVFIDKAIEGYSKQWQVSIIAPRWHVYGLEVVVNLNGSVPEDVAGKSAKEAESERPADAGVPGNPGGNAGHFLGIGDVFVNGNKLKVLGKFCENISTKK